MAALILAIVPVIILGLFIGFKSLALFVLAVICIGALVSAISPGSVSQKQNWRGDPECATSPVLQAGEDVK